MKSQKIDLRESFHRSIRELAKHKDLTSHAVAGSRTKGCRYLPSTVFNDVKMAYENCGKKVNLKFPSSISKLLKFEGFL